MEEQIDNRRQRSKELHRESQRLYDVEQNALCFVVIGAILTVIGIFFIILSFKREAGQLTEIDFASIAFIVCTISSASGIGMLTYGLVRFLKVLFMRKKVIEEINSLE